MKYIIIVILSTISFKSLSQDTANNIINFTDGYSKLNKLIFFYVGDHYNFDEVRHNIYSILNMTIDKKGKIKTINIFLIDDSLMLNVIYNAIKSTDGKWINNSNEDQIINLPINFIYGEDKAIQKDIPFQFYSSLYQNDKLQKIINFKPMIIIFYPPVN